MQPSLYQLSSFDDTEVYLNSELLPGVSRRPGDKWKSGGKSGDTHISLPSATDFVRKERSKNHLFYQSELQTT